MFNSWLENRILNKLADRLLPLVTTSDVGKSPIVALGEEQGVLILPKTTVVKAADEYPSVSADTSAISVGDKLIVTIDDTTKTLEVVEGELAPYVHFDTDFEISFGEDAITFFVVNMETGTEFTAEISKIDKVPEWTLGEGGSGGGSLTDIFDVVIGLDIVYDDAHGDTFTPTLIKGNFEYVYDNVGTEIINGIMLVTTQVMDADTGETVINYENANHFFSIIKDVSAPNVLEIHGEITSLLWSSDGLVVNS